MEIILWILAGAALGWTSCRYMGFNVERGAAVSALIGGAGALVGGEAIAPMFMAATAAPVGFSPDAMLFAAVAAVACLFLGDRLQRWGI
jgi:uncharacterized membrane protein YeaQ/YmgE (transglycosylase-associated protein family)